MQKLCSVVGAILVASTAIGAPVTYEGTLGDGTTPFSEFFADTKGSASSKTPWVHPTNVVSIAGKEATRLIGNAIYGYKVAFGTNAVAEANGAVQIGAGTNSTPDSLQFQDVVIVKDGKLVGASTAPTELNIPLNDSSIKLEPGSITTIFPDYKLYNGTELFVESPNIGDLRNYEIYLPNEPNIRTGLPIRFKLDSLPEDITKVIIDKKWQIHKLPAKVTITQPYSGLVICKIEEIDDDTAWVPVITSAHIKWNGTKFITDGSKLLEGTNLQSGVSLKIKYPISTGNVISNAIYDITGDSGVNDQGILNNTFYEYVGAFEFTPPSNAIPTVTSGSILPITLIYKTKNSVYEVEYTVNYDTLLP